MLRKSEFIQYVKFKKLNWFLKTHASICDGKFEEVWVRGSASKKKCSKCGSIVFMKPSEAMRGITEAYIPRRKLGLEPIMVGFDRETYKVLNHCVNCGQWFKLDKKQDLCSACSSVSLGDSGLNYDQFYKDKIESWSGGNKWEVGSGGKVKPKPKTSAKYKPSPAVLRLHINGWILEGYSVSDIKELVRGWIKPVTKDERVQVDAIVASAVKSSKAERDSPRSLVTTDKVIEYIRAMLSAHIDIDVITDNVKKALNCDISATSDAMIQALIKKANFVIRECDTSDTGWMSGSV